MLFSCHTIFRSVGSNHLWCSRGRYFDRLKAKETQGGNAAHRYSLCAVRIGAPVAQEATVGKRSKHQKKQRKQKRPATVVPGALVETTANKKQKKRAKKNRERREGADDVKRSKLGKHVCGPQ